MRRGEGSAQQSQPLSAARPARAVGPWAIDSRSLVSVLGTALARIFWLATGLSPWPFVVLGEVGGPGFGLALLARAAQRRSRCRPAPGP